MPGSRKSSFGETTQNRLGRPGDEQAEADRRNSSGFVNRKGGFRRGAPQGRRRPRRYRHVGAYATPEDARGKRHRRFRRGAPQGRRRPRRYRHVGAYATPEDARGKRHRTHTQPSTPRRGANLPALLNEPGGMLLPTAEIQEVRPTPAMPNEPVGDE